MPQHLQRAGVLFQLRRFEDAERELRRELVEHPDSAAAHAMLGIALSHLSRIGEAQQEVALAIEGDPTQAYSFYARSLVMIRAGRPPAALEAIREAVRWRRRTPATCGFGRLCSSTSSSGTSA